MQTETFYSFEPITADALSAADVGTQVHEFERYRQVRFHTENVELLA